MIVGVRMNGHIILFQFIPHLLTNKKGRLGGVGSTAGLQRGRTQSKKNKRRQRWDSYWKGRSRVLQYQYYWYSWRWFSTHGGQRPQLQWRWRATAAAGGGARGRRRSAWSGTWTWMRSCWWWIQKSAGGWWLIINLWPTAPGSPHSQPYLVEMVIHTHIAPLWKILPLNGPHVTPTIESVIKNRESFLLFFFKLIFYIIFFKNLLCS